MKVLNLKQIERTYKNNGQHAEQILRFNLTGKIEKADNRPAQKSADVLDIQVKSARATVCNGLDIEKYLESDKAKRYAYITSDFTTAYIMSKEEYKNFIKAVAMKDISSGKNGHKAVLRLPRETKKLLNVLAVMG